MPEAEATIEPDDARFVLVQWQHQSGQGGTTLRDFVNGNGEPGYFQQTLMVYGRGTEPCINCQKPLREIRLGQRSSVFCAHCQR